MDRRVDVLTQFDLGPLFSVVMGRSAFMVLERHTYKRKLGAIRRWLLSEYFRVLALMTDPPALIAAGTVAATRDDEGGLEVALIVHMGDVEPEAQGEIVNAWHMQYCESCQRGEHHHAAAH